MSAIPQLRYDLDKKEYPQVDIPFDTFADIKISAAFGGRIANDRSSDRHLVVLLQNGGEITVDDLMSHARITGQQVTDDFFVMIGGEVVASGDNVVDGFFTITINR